MSDLYSNKPHDYRARRQWQNTQRAAGLDPECGREVCRSLAKPAYVNKGTPLLYCKRCAAMINQFNPGLCELETSVAEGEVQDA